MDAHDWQPGDIIADKFRLEASLGRGGMATVWRARHLVLLSPVAVKLLTEADEEGRARFLREARAAAALRSPHVVQILEYGLHEDVVPYIAMELLEGETLARRLGSAGRLPWRDVVRIIAHVARAVGNAHDMGIVHRDLKPENIFLVRYHDEEVAKVLDFGIAKVLRTADPIQHVTEKGMIIGTPIYMSPEQARGQSSVDHRSDLWSLAIIVFECVCGAQPFSATTMGELALQICADPMAVPSAVARVPAAFDRWFARAAARDPDARFQSARELAEGLAAALEPAAEPAAALAGAPIDELADSFGSTEMGNGLPPSLDPRASGATPRAEPGTLLDAAHSGVGAVAPWPWRAFAGGLAVAFAGAAVATAVVLGSGSPQGAANEVTPEHPGLGGDTPHPGPGGDTPHPGAGASEQPMHAAQPQQAPLPATSAPVAVPWPEAGAPSALATATAAASAARASPRPARSGTPRGGDRPPPSATTSTPTRPPAPAATHEDLGI